MEIVLNHSVQQRLQILFEKNDNSPPFSDLHLEVIGHAKCRVCKPSCFEGVNPNARRYVRTKRTLLYK